MKLFQQILMFQFVFGEVKANRRCDPFLIFKMDAQPMFYLFKFL